MGKFKDLTGEKIGKLTVIKRVDNIIQKNGKSVIRWLCQCECGNTKIVRGDLLGRSTNSCGCLRSELNKKEKTKDPVKPKRLYRIWCGMKTRCYNIKSEAYENYGNRGIQVCEEWINNFRNFEKWALNNGYQENLTIDRIDNDDDYKPFNCRWITRKEQNRNKRNNIYITYNDEKILLKDFAKQKNINYKCLHSKYLRYKRKNNDYELSKFV